jgi:hypothetical protein
MRIYANTEERYELIETVTDDQLIKQLKEEYPDDIDGDGDLIFITEFELQEYLDKKDSIL